MTDLVTVKDGVPVTDSRTVADHFEKDHRHVLRDIRVLINGIDAINAEPTEPKFGRSHDFFIEDTYKAPRRQSDPMFWLTQDGFSLLAMGYEGPKALRFKLAFIAEFNRMRSALRDRRPSIADAVSDVERITHSLNSIFDVKKPLAAAKAITLVEVEQNINLNPVKELLPPADHDPGRLNPTSIGTLLGDKTGRYFAGKIVNKMLEGAGLQYNVGGKWILTDAGKKFGEMVPFSSRNGHTDYRPLWSPCVVSELLKWRF